MNASAQQIPTWHFRPKPSPGIKSGAEYGNAIGKKQRDHIVLFRDVALKE